MRNSATANCEARSDRVSRHLAYLEAVNIIAALHKSVSTPNNESLRQTPFRQFPYEELRLPLTAPVTRSQVQVTDWLHSLLPPKMGPVTFYRV
jgi:hypothetical protein